MFTHSIRTLMIAGALTTVAGEHALPEGVDALAALRFYD